MPNPIEKRDVRLPGCVSPTKQTDARWAGYLSRSSLMLLGLNGLIFGSLLTFAATKTVSTATAVLTISNGVMFGVLLVGALIASSKRSGKN